MSDLCLGHVGIESFVHDLEYIGSGGLSVIFFTLILGVIS